MYRGGFMKIIDNIIHIQNNKAINFYKDENDCLYISEKDIPNIFLCNNEEIIISDFKKFINRESIDYNENKHRIFKNGDIYKMHTYKDSILKTEGSYVLYPGNVHKLFKEDNDLIIPSVGAFPLAPGNGGDEEYNLSIFIKNVIRSLIVN